MLVSRALAKGPDLSEGLDFFSIARREAPFLSSSSSGSPSFSAFTIVSWAYRLWYSLDEVIHHLLDLLVPDLIEFLSEYREFVLRQVGVERVVEIAAFQSVLRERHLDLSNGAVEGLTVSLVQQLAYFHQVSTDFAALPVEHGWVHVPIEHA